MRSKKTCSRALFGQMRILSFGASKQTFPLMPLCPTQTQTIYAWTRGVPFSTFPHTHNLPTGGISEEQIPDIHVEKCLVVRERLARLNDPKEKAQCVLNVFIPWKEELDDDLWNEAIKALCKAHQSIKKDHETSSTKTSQFNFLGNALILTNDMLEKERAISPLGFTALQKALYYMVRVRLPMFIVSR